jgi:hypothetical protein
MNMTNSQICKGGAPYELKTMNSSVQKAVYSEIMNSIIEPPKSKKKFAVATEATKLEIVLIELKQKLDPIFRSAIYNIAHIYGGTDVGERSILGPVGGLGLAGSCVAGPCQAQFSQSYRPLVGNLTWSWQGPALQDLARTRFAESN